MVTFGLNSASVLAQVNVGATPATFLGIFLAVAGAALYFLRSVKPELSRDHDIFFAAVGLLCGFILIFQGWRLDPILQFGQLMLVGSTVFFAYESIRLRSIATEQAKRNTPIVDDERRVSDDYQYSNRSGRRSSRVQRDVMGAEPLPYYEDDDFEDRPRITGSRDGRSSRSYSEDYEDEAPRRSPRPSASERNERNERPSDRTRRRNSSSRPSSRNTERFDEDDWNSNPAPKQDDDWVSPTTEERRPSRRGNNGSPRPEIRDFDEAAPSKPRRRRPSDESTPRRERDTDESIPTADYTDYVDYKPLEQPEKKPERPAFDDDDASIS